jgi:hypothetical protein
MPDEEKPSYVAFVMENNFPNYHADVCDADRSARMPANGAYATAKSVPVEFHFGPESRPVYDHVLAVLGSGNGVDRSQTEDGSFIIVIKDPATAQKAQKAIRDYRPPAPEWMKFEPEPRPSYAWHVRAANFEHGLNTGTLPYPNFEEIR